MNIKLLFLSLFVNINHSLIIRERPSCLGGLELGVSTLGLGLILDNTISKESKQVLKKKSYPLYNRGIKTAVRNLIFVGPCYYWGAEHYLLSNTPNHFLLLETTQLLIIHSVGYYAAHRLMHRSDLFRKYHYFHHQFNSSLIPTIGNSVSFGEFSFAYMSPFILGALLINPSKDSFNMAIFIVSYMNLIIHTPELSNISWSPWLVSPRIHLNHHQGKNIKGTYSAPTLNLEYLYTFFKNITDFN